MKRLQMFMLDIECVGTDPFDLKAPVLQIAILELTKPSPEGMFWIPGRFFNKYLGTAKRPPNLWAEQHQAALYAKCNLTTPTSPEAVRKEILAFFCEVGAERFPTLCGKNLSLLDVPFLVQRGYLRAPGTDVQTNQPVGDFSYRLDDLSARIGLAMDLLGTADRHGLVLKARDAYPELSLPEGLEPHDGLYDCYAQTRELNGLIRLCQVRGYGEYSLLRRAVIEAFPWVSKLADTELSAGEIKLKRVLQGSERRQVSKE